MDMQLVFLPSACLYQVRHPYVMLVPSDNSHQLLFDPELCLMLNLISGLFESVQFPLFSMADDTTLSHVRWNFDKSSMGTFVIPINILTKLLVPLLERIVGKHRLSSDICLLVL
jgi:hypothetical protein